MKKAPNPLYMSAEQIEARIVEREKEAAKLPLGPRRKIILKEIAQLRLYGEAKRWIKSPGLKRGT